MENIKLSTEGMHFWVKPINADYSKRRKNTAFISVGEREVVADDSYWQEGSKAYYMVVNKHGKVVHRLREVPPPPFSDGVYDRATPTDDTAIVRFGFFCGKLSTPHIYVKSQDGWKF
jgi:hypothetical protein